MRVVMLRFWAWQWGIPAVCGFGSDEIAEGAQLLLDGRTGEVRAVEMASGSGAAGKFRFSCPWARCVQSPVSAEGHELGSCRAPVERAPSCC